MRSTMIIKEKNFKSIVIKQLECFSKILMQVYDIMGAYNDWNSWRYTWHKNALCYHVNMSNEYNCDIPYKQAYYILL